MTLTVNGEVFTATLAASTAAADRGTEAAALLDARLPSLAGPQPQPLLTLLMGKQPTQLPTICWPTI